MDGSPLVKFNPVLILTQTRQWFRVNRKQTIIKSKDLPKWFKAVIGLKSPIVRDYILTILFSGLRRNEALQLEKKMIVDILPFISKIQDENGLSHDVILRRDRWYQFRKKNPLRIKEEFLKYGETFSLIFSYTGVDGKAWQDVEIKLKSKWFTEAFIKEEKRLNDEPGIEYLGYGIEIEENDLLPFTVGRDVTSSLTGGSPVQLQQQVPPQQQPRALAPGQQPVFPPSEPNQPAPR